MMLVTKEDVSQWVGNGFDNSREEAFIEIITDVANGKYGIAELNSDISSYKWLVYKRKLEWLNMKK